MPTQNAETAGSRPSGWNTTWKMAKAKLMRKMLISVRIGSERSLLLLVMVAGGGLRGRMRPSGLVLFNDDGGKGSEMK